MIGFMALAMAFAGVQAPQDFPCGTLKDEALRVFESVGARMEEVRPGPVRLKKNARISYARFPLATRWFTLSDKMLATDGGTLPALSFRAYRIGDTTRFCTSTVRPSLFGKDDPDARFLTRCLGDVDGDGTYESFLPQTELVSYDVRTGRRGTPTGVIPQSRPLAHPVTLVESADAADPNPAFSPRVVQEIRVMKIDKTNVTVRAATQVSMLPGGSGERFRGSEDERDVTILLQDGRWTSPEGWSLLLSRKGDAWFATPDFADAAPPVLQCGGSVIRTGDTFTIMSDGGMSVVKRGNLPQR